MIPGQTSQQSPPLSPARPPVEGATGFDNSLAAVVEKDVIDAADKQGGEKYKEMLKEVLSPPPYSETDPAVIEGVVLDGK